MKHHNPLAWTLAVAIASTMPAACSLDNLELEKPFVTCPMQRAVLYACGVSQPATRTGVGVFFTEDDIEWFNINTRELRFSIPSETIRQRLQASDRFEFRLGDNVLFEVDNLVNPTVSRTYFDLVLYYEWTWDGNSKTGVGFYLYDCYPQQFSDNELTILNRTKRSPLWDTFLNYLDSKGKLKK